MFIKYKILYKNNLCVVNKKGDQKVILVKIYEVNCMY